MEQGTFLSKTIGIVIAVIVSAVVLIPICNSIADNGGGGGNGGGGNDDGAEGVLWNLDEPGYLAWETGHSSFYLDSYSLPDDLVEEIEVEVDGSTETLNGIKLTYEDIQSYGLSFGYIGDNNSYYQVMFLDANSPVGAYMVIAPDVLIYFNGTTAIMARYDGSTFYTNIPLPGLHRSVPVQFAVNDDEYAEGYTEQYYSEIGDPDSVDADDGYYYIYVNNGGVQGESPSVSTLRSLDITNPLEGGETSSLSSYAVGFRGIYPSGVGLTVSTYEEYSINNTYTEAEAIAEGILDVYDNGKYKTVYLMPTAHTANLPGGSNADYYGWGTGVQNATVGVVEQPPYDAEDFVTEDPSSGGGDGGNDLGTAGTIIKIIPIFVILGIIMGTVTLFYQNRQTGEKI